MSHHFPTALPSMRHTEHDSAQLDAFFFPTTSSNKRHTEHITPTVNIKDLAQLDVLCEKKKAITLDDLADIDAQKGEPNVVLKFDQLKLNTVHMLTEIRVLEDSGRFKCIGVLESGVEFWMPKSLYNKVKDEDPPHVFVYKRGKVSTSRTSLLRYTSEAS